MLLNSAENILFKQKFAQKVPEGDRDHLEMTASSEEPDQTCQMLLSVAMGVTTFSETCCWTVREPLNKPQLCCFCLSTYRFAVEAGGADGVSDVARRRHRASLHGGGLTTHTTQHILHTVHTQTTTTVHAFQRPQNTARGYELTYLCHF